MARLTKLERDRLDCAIDDFFFFNDKDFFGDKREVTISVKDFTNKILECYAKHYGNRTLDYCDVNVKQVNHLNFCYAFDRLNFNLYKNRPFYTYNKENDTFTFKTKLRVDSDNSSFEKEKNILTFGCYKGLTYNFITKEFSISLNEFKNVESIITASFKKMLKYEWIFNYVTDTFEIGKFACLPEQFYKEMPKGLYDYLKSNNFTLTYDLLRKYQLSNLFGKYANFVYNIFINIYCGCDIETVIKYNELCSFNKFEKICRNDLINGEFGWLNASGIRDFYDKLYKISDNPYFNTLVLDENRGLEHNFNLIKDVSEYEKNLKLAEKMKTLNFINGKVFDKYIVVVPQSQKEKVAEGKMQNNCVGYYYDDSIIEGRNLIYFIRKTDTPNKSYITCRYNLRDEDTVEYRKVNNNDVDNDEEIALVEKISKIITTNLKEMGLL